MKKIDAQFYNGFVKQAADQEMAVTLRTRTGREIFGEHQIGWCPKLNRSLLKADDYDSQWAKKIGLEVQPHELLVRVENSLTEIKDGHVHMASIAKVNTKTGSIAFTKGDEGEDGFGWDRYTRANIILCSLPGPTGPSLRSYLYD
jgi:hypothetical protein